MNSGVYQIMNKRNYHMYIGSTINFSGRWALHRNLLLNNKHPNSYLQNAWNKYGEDSFEFSIVEYIDNLNTLETREQWFTDLWNPEYAMRKECVGSQLGTKRTEETKTKIRDKAKERFKNKENHPMYGKPRSEETKRRSSESHKGQIPWNKGKTLPDEYKQKLSNSHKGKIGFWSGKQRPHETRLKISNSLKEKYKQGERNGNE